MILFIGKENVKIVEAEKWFTICFIQYKACIKIIYMFLSTGTITGKHSENIFSANTKFECPICYFPCRQFKKLHKNPNGQPPILLAFLAEMSYLNIGTNLNAPFA